MVVAIEIFKNGTHLEKRMLKNGKGVISTQHGMRPCIIKKYPITSKFLIIQIKNLSNFKSRVIS